VKKRFITAISLLFLVSYAVISYLQFHYFEAERSRLIDQQIERTTSVLASSDLSWEVLSSQEKMEGLILDTLDEDPPNEVILLRKMDGTLLYRNDLAESLDLDLSPAGKRSSVKIDGHKIRYMSYPMRSRQLIIQVGLVLDQREIPWANAIGRMLLFSLFVTVLFILLATWLTGYLLRPIKELARYFKYHALGAEEELRAPSFLSDSPEFRVLSETIQEVSGRWKNSLEEHSSMMARLVHEIRTPLTVLRNRLETLLGEGSPGPAREAIAELDHIETLTRDFAHWSKIEYSMPSDPSLHAISALSFVEALDCVRNGSRRLRLDFRAPAHTKIFARPEHLRLLFENLVSNAFRHGEEDRPVTLLLEERWFEVRNSGLPVPEAVLKNLGKPFNRGNEAAGGSGLGLANIVSLCKKYGWDFTYRRDGGENVFRVEFTPA
jgi:signal transduction histidine kinase